MQIRPVANRGSRFLGKTASAGTTGIAAESHSGQVKATTFAPASDVLESRGHAAHPVRDARQTTVTLPRRRETGRRIALYQTCQREGVSRSATEYARAKLSGSRPMRAMLPRYFSRYSGTSLAGGASSTTSAVHSARATSPPVALELRLKPTRGFRAMLRSFWRSGCE